MTYENNSREYLKVVKDILESEMSLTPASTLPEDQRVIIWRQNYTLPKKDWLIVILSESPGKTMASTTTPASVTGNMNELQEVLMAKQINIDVFSRNTDAWERKEEVVMALSSTYSQQKQDAHGFVIFPCPTPFVDVSEAEGAGNVFRFRTTFTAHVRYSKTKAITYYDKFQDVEVTDD